MDVALEIRLGKQIISNLLYVLDFTLVGSAVYSKNPKDVDFAVLLYPNVNLIQYQEGMVKGGWDSCANLDYLGMGSTWFSVRQENINLIITTDQKFFDGYKTATEVCKALRLEHKQDRIAVHYIIRDGATADEVTVNNTYALEMK